MLDYLTHPKFLNYNTNNLPSSQGGTRGSLSIKTANVITALRQIYPKTRAISDSDQITADTILIEPSRFIQPTNDNPDKPHDSPYELIQKLKEHSAKKILYCSDLSLIQMHPPLRNQLIDAVDLATVNSDFQRSSFKYINFFCKHTLCNPAAPVFTPSKPFSDRENILVATGNISWRRNIRQVIEAFRILKNQVRTSFIGSAFLWNENNIEPEAAQLQEELYTVTDSIVKEATTPEIAKTFHSAKFGLWANWHDSAHLTLHEMLMSGLTIVTSKHAIAESLPVYNHSGVAEQVAALHGLIQSDSELLERQSEKITKWAQENVSYSTFLDQITAILKEIW